MSEYRVWLAKFLTRIFLVIGIIIVIGLLGAGDTSDKRVAVVKLEGVIEDSTQVIEALYKQVNDKNIKAVVLRVDSPGGAVAPSQEIFEAVRKLKEKKPIVASMGSVAASGGLFAAVGASKIFCQAGTQTGSIGVILQIPNVSKVADKVGFQMTTIKSGGLKDAGNIFRDMTPDEQKYLEGVSHTIHESFIKAVVDGRGIKDEVIRPYADGRVILGSEAVELGLVDGFGDIYDAARAALELAKVKLEADELPKLVYANKKPGVLSELFGSEGSLESLFSRFTRASGASWSYFWF